MSASPFGMWLLGIGVFLAASAVQPAAGEEA